MQTLEAWGRARYLSVTEAPHEFLLHEQRHIITKSDIDICHKKALWNKRQRWVTSYNA